MSAGPDTGTEPAAVGERHGNVAVVRTTYALGAGFLRWVRLAQRVWEVGPEVHAEMRELSDRCGETVIIYVRQEESRICIAQEEGAATVRSVFPAPLPLAVGVPPSYCSPTRRSSWSRHSAGSRCGPRSSRPPRWAGRPATGNASSAPRPSRP